MITRGGQFMTDSQPGDKSTLDIAGSIYKGARAKSAMMENKKGQEEMQEKKKGQAVQDIYNKTKQKGGTDAEFMKEITKSGLASQGAAFMESVNKMQMEGQAGQHIRGAASWLLMEKDPEAKKKKIGSLNKLIKENGMPDSMQIPEDADDVYIAGKYLNIGDTHKALDERYYKELIAEARKQEAENRKNKGGKGGPTGGGRDKTMNEAQIVAMKAKKSRLATMSEEEKEEMKYTNPSEYQKLEQGAQEYDEYMGAHPGSKPATKASEKKKPKFKISKVE